MAIHENPASRQGPLTIADAIVVLQADTSLPTRRRQALLSALRTLARVARRDPSDISADPPLLRDVLATLSPAVAGISRARLRNVRSLTLSALRWAGVKVMQGRNREPLSAEWDALRVQLPDAGVRAGLSRFMSFCTAWGITPAMVDAETFESYRQALATESLVKDPGGVDRTTCKLWNQAAETIDGWPDLRVAVPSRSRRYAMYWEDFPASFKLDAEAYLHRLGNQDVFAPDYALSAEPSTVALRRRQILQLGTGLVSAGFPIEDITDLAVLAQTENVERALRFFYDRAGRRSTKHLHQHAMLIKGIALHWVKADPAQVTALGAFARRLTVKNTGMTDKNRSRLRQFDNPDVVDVLLRLPRRILSEVRRDDGGLQKDALRVMHALAVEILIVAPMRVGNLVGLNLERHVVTTRTGKKSIRHLVIPAEEVKNDAAYEMQLPAETADLLDIYLTQYRPRLVAVSSPLVFANAQGKPRAPTTFGTTISSFLLKEAGIRMNVHLFRHLAVRLHLEAYPGDLETARRILGHKNITTTLKSYAETKTAGAFHRYNGMIMDRRAGRGRSV